MTIPKLRQYSDFRPEDFHDCAIWMCVHGVDEEAEWYYHTDELTYRPWPLTGAFPNTEPTAPSVIVHTRFRVADGSVYKGFSTPAFLGKDRKAQDISYTQPILFLPNGELAGFWLGNRRIIAAHKIRLYAALHKGPKEVFPIIYSPFVGAVTDPYELTIESFSCLDPDLHSEC